MWFFPSITLLKQSEVLKLTLKLHLASFHSLSFILLCQHDSPQLDSLFPWNIFFLGYWDTTVAWFSSDSSIPSFSVSFTNFASCFSKLQMLEQLGSELPSILYLDTLPCLMASSVVSLKYHPYADTTRIYISNIRLSLELQTFIWNHTVQLSVYKYGGGLVAQSCPTLAIPWTVACQAPLSMGFSRQEYWSGLPFPSPGDLPNPGIL